MMAKQVLFFNPNYEVQMRYHSLKKDKSNPPVQSGIGEVVKEIGGVVIEVAVLAGGSTKLINTTNMIVEYIGIINQLTPHVKMLFQKIFGTAEQREARRVLRETRKNMNEYSKLIKDAK